MMNFVAIDFETANSNHNSACAIGLAVVENMAIVERQVFLIRPPSSSFIFTSLHGISWNDVKHQPTFSQLWPKIKQIISDRPLTAHNASFDTNVLRETLRYYGISCPSIPCACSVQIARRVWPDLPSHKLDAVASHLNLHLKHHDAASDSEVCAQIVIGAALVCGHDSLIEMAQNLKVRYDYLMSVEKSQRKSPKKKCPSLDSHSGPQIKVNISKPLSASVSESPDTYRYPEDIKSLRIAVAEGAKLVCELRVRHGLGKQSDLNKARKVLDDQIEKTKQWDGVVRPKSLGDVPKSGGPVNTDDAQAKNPEHLAGCLLLVIVAVIFTFLASHCDDTHDNKQHAGEESRVEKEAERNNQERSIQERQYRLEQEQITIKREQSERLQEIRNKREILLEEQEELRRQFNTVQRRSSYAWATDDDHVRLEEVEKKLKENEQAVNDLNLQEANLKLQ